ncbi:hypothetical protein OIO90_001687 [Microbotryomycetes sp. JL221]|nr:hypothetical protein OIO90_001687 [Microbotryomycetes sp. JL221]
MARKKAQQTSSKAAKQAVAAASGSVVVAMDNIDAKRPKLSDDDTTAAEPQVQQNLFSDMPLEVMNETCKQMYNFALSNPYIWSNHLDAPLLPDLRFAGLDDLRTTLLMFGDTCSV